MSSITMPRSRQDKSTRFLITINNYTDEELEKLKELETKYCVIAKEVAPTTGTPHIHCLLCYQSQVRIPSIKKKFPRARIDVVRGTFKAARDYVIKAGNIYFESGTQPRSHNVNDSWKDAVKAAKEGTIDKESLMYCRYQHFLDRLLPRIEYVFDGELDTKNAWIYGAPGTGKSRLVRQYAASRNYTVYEKLSNKWWDDFREEDIVYIEDLDPSVCKVLVHHIKLWADRYPFRAEIKGSSVRILPKFQLIVTSNYSIGECFEGKDCEAISRRFYEWRID
nr:MAG: replication associated protein [Cressdnaviricota sp.]